MKYFKESEWIYNSDKVDKKLKNALDKVRDIANVPIIINVAYNDSGHSKNSYHYKGKAVDFYFKGLTNLEQFACISAVPELKGIGYYPWWNNPGWHCDIRENNLFWISPKYENYIYDSKKLLNYLIRGKL